MIGIVRHAAGHTAFAWSTLWGLFARSFPLGELNACDYNASEGVERGSRGHSAPQIEREGISWAQLRAERQGD